MPTRRDRFHKYRLSTLQLSHQFKLTNPDKEDIVSDIGKAMHHFHSLGIAHGEINAEHVIIDEVPAFLFLFRRRV